MQPWPNNILESFEGFTYDHLLVNNTRNADHLLVNNTSNVY
mgnify:FL=1|jgi:hypothetical protein